MLMLSYNINSMLCRSFPSVWQVPPIRVKLPCVRVRAFLIMKILPWSSLVFFCCCSCILPTSGLARNINNVNSLKELFQFSAHNMPKKYKVAKYYKCGMKILFVFSHIFWLFFTCALFCSSSLFLLLFLFRKCFAWDGRSASWYLGSFFVFWQKSRWYRDICSLISSGGSSSGFLVVILVVKLKYHYFFECNYEIIV